MRGGEGVEYGMEGGGSKTCEDDEAEERRKA